MAGIQKPQAHRDLSSASNAIPATRAPLLKTCQNCSHAKIRCDRARSAGPCDRCLRLHKDCVYPPVKARSLPSKRRNSRIDALEARIESLLPAHQADSPMSGTEPSDDGLARSAAARFDSVSSSDSLYGSVFSISRDLAESLLQTYKSSMHPHFPFVSIAPNQDAVELRLQRPALFLAIAAAAAASHLTLQRQLHNDFRTLVTRKLLGDDGPTLEILQAILVHLAWSQFHSRPRRFTQYLQLAISIVVDLRLDRPRNSYLSNIVVQAEPQVLVNGQASSWGADEMRAVLGCYYLSSSVSTLLQKTQVLHHSTCIDDYTLALGPNATKIEPDDKYLYYVVQIQRIMGLAEQATRSQNGASRLEARIAELRTELGSVKSRMPFTMVESGFLVMQYHTAELYTCQVNLIGTGFTPHNPSFWTTTRLEILSDALVAVKSLLSFYVSLPLRTEAAFNNTEWIQLAFGLITGAKLAVLSGQSAIRQKTTHLRRFLGISDLLRQVIQRMESASDASNDTQEPFRKAAARMRPVLSWYERQTQLLAAISSPSTADHTQSADSAPLTSTSGDPTPGADPMPDEALLHWDDFFPSGIFDFGLDGAFSDPNLMLFPGVEVVGASGSEGGQYGP